MDYNLEYLLQVANVAEKFKDAYVRYGQIKALESHSSVPNNDRISSAEEELDNAAKAFYACLNSQKIYVDNNNIIR